METCYFWGFSAVQGRATILSYKLASHKGDELTMQLHKFYIVVILLTGAIPDRSTFRKPVLKEALTPYFQIVQGKFS
jgi:hypothetical protein